ncbi:MAG TPA: hypothetical protein PK605_07245 [Ignavibacteria bacterium]|nr:hypothetical protein [Bacteroidota bacterium]HRE09414.1 hypothetical protein [Ignavibacteria bacterium]HRF64539.1 hypothetical protein [Ignavibacteria bacterium]HRJ04181.1 hypothetical protein [Ignavibacteria bacterium]HRJ84501.1 hypothetical protein [Ignavibacteria bacterium]
MKIKIKTKVEQDFRSVFQAFDIKLFMKLKPPFVGLNVIRFDGCKKNDIVDVEINILGFKQRWVSVITDNGESASEVYFVDEGKDLPKPLKDWKHRHIIEKSVDSSIIIDDITYSSGNFLMDLLLFPAFFLQFYYRKPVYRSYFRKLN